jgi:hypothetical protein
MSLRIRKTKKLGKARVVASKKGVSASAGGRARLGVSRRGIRGSIRILPGISWRWRS